jgi:hypothetical protein
MLSEQERDPDGHPGIPKLKPDFLIETYLDHQVSVIALSLWNFNPDNTGRKVLSDIRREFIDLPLESNGLVRHDRSSLDISR